MNIRSFLLFVFMAFALAWVGWLPQVLEWPHPAWQILLLLPMVAPGAAAILAVRSTETHGVKELLRSLLRWRVNLGWWTFAVFGPCFLFACAIALDMIIGQFAGRVRTTQADLLPILVSTLVISLLSNPWEEIGWRGFLLPRLQGTENDRNRLPGVRRYSAVTASLFVGVIWGLWHLPLFLWQANPMSQQPFLSFMLGILAESVIYTWLFNSTRQAGEVTGSLLLVTIFHISTNVTGAVLGASYEISRLSLAYAEWIFVFTIILLYGPQYLRRMEKSE